MTSEAIGTAAEDAALDVPGRTITLKINGRLQRVIVRDRQLLVEILRETLGLTGTRVGCYGGDCGACTVRINGRVAKSCLVLGASADGDEVVTIEGYSPDGELDDLQRALWEHDAFQCGFCIAGHLFVLRDLLDRNADPTETEIREALIGNLCRCTGYMNLVAAARDAAARRRSSAGEVGSQVGPVERTN